MAYQKSLVRGGTFPAHHTASVPIASIVTGVSGVIAALAALTTVMIALRALKVARETLGEATRSRKIAEADRRAAESDRKAAEADRKRAEADRQQARIDRDFDYGQRLRDGQREGLLRIAEILEQVNGLAWNDTRYNPPTDTWLTGRHLLAAALVGTYGLSNCEAILNVEQASAALSGVVTARQELKAALAKNAEATADARQRKYVREQEEKPPASTTDLMQWVDQRR